MIDFATDKEARVEMSPFPKIRLQTADYLDPHKTPFKKMRGKFWFPQLLRGKRGLGAVNCYRVFGVVFH